MSALPAISRRHPLAPPVQDMLEDARRPCKIGHGTQPWSGPFDGDVLVTGATGFVAPFVIDELLRSGSYRVVCLVRADDNAHASQRVRDRLAALGLRDAAASARIECLSADLTLPHFGMVAATVNSLGARVGEIFHFGSVVRWFTRYSTVRPCDVWGTHAMLRFATQGRLKRMHVGASMASQVPIDACSSPIAEDTSHEQPERLLGGYCQSKWVVEHMLDRARVAGIPINVFRLGDIKGVSEHGAGNAFDFGYSLMAWCMQRGVAPKLDYRVSYLPVDEVAASIVKIARRTNGRGRLYQFTNPQDATWDDVLDLMDNSATPVRRLELDEFSQRLHDDTQSGAARRTKPSFRSIAPGGGLPRTSFLQLGLELYQRPHTTHNTAVVLPETPAGVRTRLIADGLLSRYVRFARDIDIDP